MKVKKYPTKWNYNHSMFFIEQRLKEKGIAADDVKLSENGRRCGVYSDGNLVAEWREDEWIKIFV